MPRDCPSQLPCTYEQSAPAWWMDGKIKEKLEKNNGQCVLCQWVERIKDILYSVEPRQERTLETTNMVAYRIEQKTAKSTKLVQDFNEEGEANAGSWMLHLLQVHDLKNTVVIWQERIRDVLHSVELRLERVKTKIVRKKSKDHPTECPKAVRLNLIQNLQSVLLFWSNEWCISGEVSDTNSLYNSQAEHNSSEIIHGEVIVDRNCIFQDHAIRVAVLATLKLKRKIQNAKHNIVGYRVEQKTAKGTKLVQDFDEDGDAHAAPVSGCYTYCMCTT
ncbi:hypothetical protein HW555_001009 [Spodoptera exigua]|uniref:Uncharacterized protein n=1 Tax=Spodoptera exigua TaxID=7107 RepID=A0A835LAU5_SPOEX|nr:hypothetical protein HW555_001009 [Spodoptera exigua]